MNGYGTLIKILDWFFWGVFMGMGWIVGTNVLNFIGSFMHGHS